MEQQEAVEKIEGGSYGNGIGQIAVARFAGPKYEGRADGISQVTDGPLFDDPARNRGRGEGHFGEVLREASAMIA
jgi:hypothetical protein